MDHSTRLIVRFSTATCKPAAILLAVLPLLAGCSTATNTSAAPRATAPSGLIKIVTPNHGAKAATPFSGEIEISAGPDGVPEVHIHTQQSFFRIIVHRTTPQGDATATTISLNGPDVDLRDFQKTKP